MLVHGCEHLDISYLVQFVISAKHYSV